MNEKYFLKKNKNMSGPYTLSNLKTKPLKASDLVWFEGLADWTPAGNIEKLGIMPSTPLSQPTKRINLKKLLSRLLPAGK